MVFYTLGPLEEEILQMSAEQFRTKILETKGNESEEWIRKSNERTFVKWTRLNLNQRRAEVYQMGICKRKSLNKSTIAKHELAALQPTSEIRDNLKAIRLYLTVSTAAAHTKSSWTITPTSGLTKDRSEGALE